MNKDKQSPKISNANFFKKKTIETYIDKREAT